MVMSLFCMDNTLHPVLLRSSVVADESSSIPMPELEPELEPEPEPGNPEPVSRWTCSLSVH